MHFVIALVILRASARPEKSRGTSVTYCKHPKRLRDMAIAPALDVL